MSDPTILELQAENTRLRAALAMSDRPCVYCTLPADRWAECKSGFPGCARSDDAVGCPHLGDGLALAEAMEIGSNSMVRAAVRISLNNMEMRYPSQPEVLAPLQAFLEKFKPSEE